MDIEKLIEQLRTESLYADKASLDIMDLCMDSATALSTLQAENTQLRAELEKVKAENATLSAAMLTIQKSDNLERMEVVYKMDYATALSQRQLCDVAWIVFRGLLQEDLKWRGPQKEG